MDFYPMIDLLTIEFSTGLSFVRGSIRKRMGVWNVSTIYYLTISISLECCVTEGCTSSIIREIYDFFSVNWSFESTNTHTRGIFHFTANNHHNSSYSFLRWRRMVVFSTCEVRPPENQINQFPTETLITNKFNRLQHLPSLNTNPASGENYRSSAEKLRAAKWQKFNRLWLWFWLCTILELLLFLLPPVDRVFSVPNDQPSVSSTTDCENSLPRRFYESSGFPTAGCFSAPGLEPIPIANVWLSRVWWDARFTTFALCRVGTRCVWNRYFHWLNHEHRLFSFEKSIGLVV